ncbi:hypothetical protein ACFQ9V_12385 [Leifsonia sp. NPDC056665]|uniref:hypothetical protein n=1 Tax=Leifsonia sp. NPDC056665 TaxID=3345901 RepID=UPI0036B31198
MGLIYRSNDSSSVITALTKNLAQGHAVLSELEIANAHVVGSLEGGDLSGKGYAAARTLFEEQVGSAIAEHQELLDSLRRDLDVNEREDSRVSQHGVLHEGELNVQLHASRAMKLATEDLIEVNAAAAGAISAVPLLGESLQLLNRQLEMVVDQLDRTVRGLEDRLAALLEFDMATSGLFQQAVAAPAGAVSAASALTTKTGKKGQQEVRSARTSTASRSVRPNDPASSGMRISSTTRPLRRSRITRVR